MVVWRGEAKRILDEVLSEVLEGRSVAVYPDGSVERYPCEVEFEIFVWVDGRRHCVRSGLSFSEVVEIHKELLDGIDSVSDWLPEWVLEREEKGAKVAVEFSAVTGVGPVVVFCPVDMRMSFHELVHRAAYGVLLLGFTCPGPNADVVGINIQVKEIPDECLWVGMDMRLTLKHELAHVVRPTYYQRKRVDHSPNLEWLVRDTIGVRGIRWFFSVPEGPPDP